MVKCIEKYKELYNKEPIDVSFCPYRVCPIGAHVDHNLGKITGFAIDKGINVAYGVNNKIIVNSLDFENEYSWALDVNKKENDWADYLRGTTYCLNKVHPLTKGIDCVIEGSLPIGGLSSSAAVIISFLVALCKVNNIELTCQELIDIAYDAERNFVGVNVGKLDQSCEVLSKKNHLLYLDTKDNSYELIKMPENMKPFDIVIFYSGLEHALISSKYNDRVMELKKAARKLADKVGIVKEDVLCRDVSKEVFDKYKNELDEEERLRATHWYTEVERVEKGAEAFRKGDIEEYGRLSFESGLSSINNWQSGAPEQIKLYEIMKETKGIYGGRFSGAGFKGCCLALVDPKYTKEVIEEVSKKYLESFPHLKGKYAAFVCDTADGINI